MKMIKQIKIIALTCLLLSPARPLSREALANIATAGGVATLALVSCGTNYLVFNEKNFPNTDPTLRTTFSMLAGTGASLLTMLLLTKLLYSYTPAAKFTATKELYNSASTLYLNAARDPLLEKYFSTESELHDYVTAHFGTSWPLVQARKSFMDLKETLMNARLLAEQCRNAVRFLLIDEPVVTSKHYTELRTHCIDLLDKIAILEVFRDDRTVAITNNQQYVIQTKLYENHQEAEIQRKHTEKEARCQREHERQLEFAKLSHKSNTQR